ncbi:hypothetical protein KFL_011230030 [Klebsormidium nitens]|uniref:Uncharacterized protein n=1 Tax=Klebsormidium nitens TaxID=105231 RepID=A0A1Y1IVN1_KLENI|nr:hypothetical protein KFL_011230030 [Klebsormidium nitens]|eukprot:GAQ92757.1 hypothetical protein KFL_011230030 [Klebsormidium nitens]
MPTILALSLAFNGHLLEQQQQHAVATPAAEVSPAEFIARLTSQEEHQQQISGLREHNLNGGKRADGSAQSEAGTVHEGVQEEKACDSGSRDPQDDPQNEWRDWDGDDENESEELSDQQGPQRDAVEEEDFQDLSSDDELSETQSADEENEISRESLEVKMEELLRLMNVSDQECEEEDMDHDAEGVSASLGNDASSAQHLWRNRRFQPLFSGSSSTVLAAAMEALQEKRSGGIGNNTFDRQCKRIARLLPQPNLYPPSLYAMKQVVGAEDLSPYVVHCCVNDCVRFERFPEKEWRLHKDELCPACDERRFEEYRTQKGPRLRPRNYCIDFGFEKSIKELWADPEFCKARNEDGTRDPFGDDFWGGRYAAEIDAKVGGGLFRRENGGYEIGFDFAKPYKGLQFSMGFVFLRSLDLSSTRRSEKRFRQVLIIIRGPKEPTWIAPYFEGVLGEAAKGGTQGFEITVDSSTKQTTRHRTYVCLISTDTLARNALQEFVAATAYLGCGYCWFEGSKYEGPKQGVYFAGYAKPAPQHIRGGGKGLLAGQAPRRTHEQHLRHGEAVENEEESEEETGYKGVCCVAKFLPYFDVTKGFLLPIAHGCLLGNVKDFLNVVMADYKLEADRPEHVMTKANRRKVVERQGEIRWTHEHGSPGKCVVKHRGSMTMSELLQFVETSSVYVMRGCLTPELDKAWRHLRAVVLHYCRITDDGMDMEQRVKAKQNALAYAKIVEQEIGPHMCKLNLHMIVNHAFDQETATGATAKSLEWWVEQGVQEMKQTVANMGLTWQPAKVIGNDVLLKKALINCAIEVPEYAPLVGLSEVPEPEQFKGPTDELQDGVQFLHVGRKVRLGQLGDDALADLGSFAESAEFTTDQTRWSVHEFRAAQVRGEGFQAREHYATKVRHSFNVQVRVALKQGRQAKLAYATVLRFFRVLDGVTGDQLRVVQLDVFGQAKTEKGLDVIDASQPIMSGKFFDVSCLITKFVFVKEKGNEKRTFVLPCRSRGL